MYLPSNFWQPSYAAVIGRKAKHNQCTLWACEHSRMGKIPSAMCMCLQAAVPPTSETQIQHNWKKHHRQGGCGQSLTSPQKKCHIETPLLKHGPLVYIDTQMDKGLPLLVTPIPYMLRPGLLSACTQISCACKCQYWTHLLGNKKA